MDKANKIHNVKYDVNILKEIFLNQYWHKDVLLIEKEGRYLISYPPCKAFLRYSKGPRQHYYWDFAGDDFLKPEFAFYALMMADAPSRQYIEVKQE